MAKIIGNPTVTPMAIPDWNQTDETKADYIKNKPTLGNGLSSNDYTDEEKEKLANLNKRIKFAEVNGTDSYNNDILWQNHSWFNGVKDETFNSQLPTSLDYEDFGLYVIKYWTGGLVSPQTLLLNYGDYYNENNEEILYQTVIDDKGAIYRRTVPYHEPNWEGISWEKVSSSGGITSEELDKRIKYINAWDYIPDGENYAIDWYSDCDLFFKDIYESGIYSVSFNPDDIGDAYGILIVGNEESWDDEDNICLQITQAFMRGGSIETRYARMSYETNEYTEWSKWKPPYATTDSVNFIKTSVNNLSQELDKRIKYIDTSAIEDMDGNGNWWDWYTGSQYYFKDVYEEGIYAVLYSADAIGYGYGLLIVSNEEDYVEFDDGEERPTTKTIQTFIRDSATVRRYSIRYIDKDWNVGDWGEWSEWEPIYAKQEYVDAIKTSVTNVSKELDDRIKTLHYKDKEEWELGINYDEITKPGIYNVYESPDYGGGDVNMYQTKLLIVENLYGDYCTQTLIYSGYIKVRYLEIYDGEVGYITDWEEMYKQVASIAKEYSDNTIVLYHNREARLGVRTTLILSMPSSIDERYESHFTFSSGETPTNLNYSSTPIRWSGDDVDYEGTFIPEANKIYEVAVKYLGDDTEGNPIISARVGVV